MSNFHFDLSLKKMSNFHFDLSLKLSQGEVHDFSGEVQKGVAKRSLGRCAPPHTFPQNPAMISGCVFHLYEREARP
jgi:hypothetical protein